MVKNMNREIFYTEADENELDELLSGHAVGLATNWGQWFRALGPRHGATGVIWTRGENSNDPARPLVLISHEDEIRRLCGRYSQLHSDLSPLTSWCHLITPRFFESFDSLVRVPELGGMEAAWSGLAVAESVLLAERRFSNVRISACLATHSFAVARTTALWSHVPLKEIRGRFDIASRICRSEGANLKSEERAIKVRDSLEPLWESLIAVSRGNHITKSGELGPIVEALIEYRRAKAEKTEKEAEYLFRGLSVCAPEAIEFERLSDLAPESRLRLFDRLISALGESKGGHSKLRRNALGLLAGYLATIAAGGATSLSLAEDIAVDFPEVTAWAYLVGGIGESVVWTSSFDGLGRLVARELLRPVRLDDSPTCDFSLDEANVLADPKLSDPLVHLRVKQARLLTVSLLPGVNVQLPLQDSVAVVSGRGEQNRRTLVSDRPERNDTAAAFVDAFWPNIQNRIDDYLRYRFESGPYSGGGNTQSTREKGRGDSQRSSSSKPPKRP